MCAEAGEGASVCGEVLDCLVELLGVGVDGFEVLEDLDGGGYFLRWCDGAEDGGVVEGGLGACGGGGGNAGVLGDPVVVVGHRYPPAQRPGEPVVGGAGVGQGGYAC